MHFNPRIKTDTCDIVSARVCVSYQQLVCGQTNARESVISKKVLSFFVKGLLSRTVCRKIVLFNLERKFS